MANQSSFSDSDVDSVLSNIATLESPILVTTAEEPTSTSYRVTNINDSGAGSLRQAILDANLSIGAATISFDASLAGQTITLGGSELLITDDLLIDGDIDNDGVADITIDANQQSRVINIDDDSEAVNKNVTLDGLTITGGLLQITDDTSTIEGGGVRSKESLTLTNSTITGNSLETTQSLSETPFGTFEYFDILGTSLGGGIFSSGGNLTITNSRISGNSVEAGVSPAFFATDSPSFGNSKGGGIFSEDGDLTVVASKISGNSTRFGRNSQGGGIYSRNGSTTVDRSTLSDNASGVGGGGIDSDNLVLTSSTVSGNHTRGAFFSEGGGVRADNATVRNSTIVDNSVSVSDYFISNDIAIGGGIAGGNLSLYNSIVAGNRGSGGEVSYNSYNDISIGYGNFSGSPGTITGANNLIGEGDSLALDPDTNLVDGVNGNQVGTEANPIDPNWGRCKIMVAPPLPMPYWTIAPRLMQEAMPLFPMEQPSISAVKPALWAVR